MGRGGNGRRREVRGMKEWGWAWKGERQEWGGAWKGKKGIGKEEGRNGEGLGRVRRVTDAPF